MGKVKIEKTQVFGFESALRGLRNPMNSWDKSDSFDLIKGYESAQHEGYYGNFVNGVSQIIEQEDVDKLYEVNLEGFVLGNVDEVLAQKLTKVGSEHCKFLRQIHVWADFTFPRYIWSELDTYSYNTKNSTSTMHKLMSRNLVKEDFIYDIRDEHVIMYIIEELNDIRFKYTEADTIERKHSLLRRAKQLLPEGYLQMRTMDTNYAELLNIYNQRKNHKLKHEWQEIFCSWVENLPYFVALTGIERKFT